MTIHLFDDYSWDELLPMAYTRPLAGMRCGIYTPEERLKKLAPDVQISYVTQDYLSEKYPYTSTGDDIYISGKWIICDQILNEIRSLQSNTGLKKGSDLLAFRSSESLSSPENIQQIAEQITWWELEDEQIVIRHMWDLFSSNAAAIESDWAWLTHQRKSQGIAASNTIIGNPDNIFLEEGAQVEASILAPGDGKIYLGQDSQIMIGSMVYGSLSMLDNAVLKMGSKIYGATSLGRYCKVGGEVNNSVFFEYSNKGHDGFLGNSVVGAWCNFGADSNNSNLKNNYAEVKLWSESKSTFERTGLQFCGLMMADHSKCGINTMFNTGTVVGVSCNIYGAGFPRNFVPSFSWGGAQGYTEYKLPKAFETMQKVMERREVQLQEEDKKIFEYIFNKTQNQRNF